MKFSPWGWRSILAVVASFVALVLVASSILNSGNDLLPRRWAIPSNNAAFLEAWIERNGDENRTGGDLRPSITPSLSPAIGSSNGSCAPVPSPRTRPKYFNRSSAPSPAPIGACDLFSGRWVRDEDTGDRSHPLFQPFVCPFTDEAFQCVENGRNHSGYLHWRWQPQHCDLPRFNATDMLERLRGKTLAFVGDSLGRNQWESLVCMLYQVSSNRGNIYEAHRQTVAKAGFHYSIVFADFDVHIDFYRSNFLVAENRRLPDRRSANCTLSLDRLDQTARQWRSADIIIFNSGHWWEHHTIHSGECFFIQGSNYTTRMDPLAAFEASMKTWSRWIDRHISKTQKIFVRGYSPNHFSGGDWDSGGSCESHLEPLGDESKLEAVSSKVKVFERVLRKMRKRVTFLNITKLTLYRKDGHVARWGKKQGWDIQDCSHWCLPGVPDTWNELFYASLVKQQL